VVRLGIKGHESCRSSQQRQPIPEQRLSRPRRLRRLQPGAV